MFFQEKQKSSQRKIHKSFAKQFIEIPLKMINVYLHSFLTSKFLILLLKSPVFSNGNTNVLT